MKQIILSLGILTISLTLCAPAVADDILVQTDMIPASEFTPWEEADPTKYEGKYAGDVGGDTAASLEFKVSPAKDGESLGFASGTYERQTVSTKPTVVKFSDAYYWGDQLGVFEGGAFKIRFVKFNDMFGVIIGDAFLPKE